MTTTPRGARTRSNLLRIAGDTFTRRGYADASLDDIVKAAGLTKGAFYFHFTSKEVLAHAVVDAYHAALEQTQAQLDATEPDPLRRIVRLVFAAVDGYQRSPIARGTTRLLEESNQFQKPLRLLSDTWLAWLLPTLEQARRAGRLTDGAAPADLAELLVAGVYGVLQFSYTRTGYADLADRQRRLLWFLLSAMVQPAEQAEELRSWIARQPEPPADAGIPTTVAPE